MADERARSTTNQRGGRWRRRGRRASRTMTKWKCGFTKERCRSSAAGARVRHEARLDGKTALVTGGNSGNSGIGNETVLDFYKRDTKFNIEDLNYKHHKYNSYEAYAQSKLANVLFSKELASKLKEYNIEGVNTYSLHPGVIKTEGTRHMDETVFRGSYWLYRNIVVPFIKTTQQGAQTQIYCSVDEKCTYQTGLYYSDCAVVKPSTCARSDSNAKNLWEVSCKLVGLENFNPSTTDAGVKV